MPRPSADRTLPPVDRFTKVVRRSLLLGAILALPTALRAEEGHSGSMQKAPQAKAEAASVPEGYHVEIAAQGLNFPTSVELDDKGRLLIAEAGKVPGNDQSKPRILRISRSGQEETLIREGLESPVNDLLWHDGQLYVSHRGKISVWQDGRSLRDMVTGLPSRGDHHNNQITLGPDGMLYFGQGTATNSGVVGPDNAKMGWLKKHPDVHDVVPTPLARQAKLRDRVFASPNPLTEFRGDTRITSAFAPFGKVQGDQPLSGEVRANGTILKMNADGSGLAIHAYGFRNPFGLLWGADGRLYATENGFDVRGSRPIANDWEDLYVVREGGFYGWPDYGSGVPVTDPQFSPKKKGAAPVKFLLRDHPPVEQPLHRFTKHSAIAKLDASPGGNFGHEGQLFIAFYGHWTPMTGKAPARHGGHRVVRFNPRGGEVQEFFARADHGHNKSDSSKGSKDDSSEAKASQGKKAAGKMDRKSQKQSGKGQHSDSHYLTAGPRRPIDVRFAPNGSAMYIADFGILQVHVTGDMKALPGTGVIWKVVPAN